MAGGDAEPRLGRHTAGGAVNTAVATARLDGGYGRAGQAADQRPRPADVDPASVTAGAAFGAGSGSGPRPDAFGRVRLALGVDAWL